MSDFSGFILGSGIIGLIRFSKGLAKTSMRIKPKGNSGGKSPMDER
jgi:hypothetical protein